MLNTLAGRGCAPPQPTPQSKTGHDSYAPIVPSPASDDILSPESLDRLAATTLLECAACHEVHPVSEVTLGSFGWICARCVESIIEDWALPSGNSPIIVASKDD